MGHAAVVTISCKCLDVHHILYGALNREFLSAAYLSCPVRKPLARRTFRTPMCADRTSTGQHTVDTRWGESDVAFHRPMHYNCMISYSAEVFRTQHKSLESRSSLVLCTHGCTPAMSASSMAIDCKQCVLSKCFKCQATGPASKVGTFYS
jgi:hypothetical protein